MINPIKSQACRLKVMDFESQLTSYPTLLVYLPCYSDYKLAIEQAKQIRQIKKHNVASHDLRVQTMISINGVDLSSEELKEVIDATDYHVIYPFGISGDINITQGFMHAIRLQADYLWILSANDSVADTFIDAIGQHLLIRPEADLLVGCTSNKLGIREINSVFDKENRDIPFGLISSVIYRTSKTANNFDSAVQLNWTGWGQLATIEASCIARNGLRVSLIAEKTLYNRSERGHADSKIESQRIRNGYAHSFFGMPIVINSLFSGNPVRRKKLLNAWIESNWYLVNYFLKSDFKLWSAHLASNQSWLRILAFAVIRNASPAHRILFALSKVVPVEIWRDSPFAKWALGYSRGKK